MHLAAFAGLLMALLIYIGLGAHSALRGWGGSDTDTSVYKLGNIGATLCVVFSSFILTVALSTSDYSFKYVRDYTDNFLPMFYKVTAFWAGQEGSLLFWALCASLVGVLFSMSGGYRRLSERTKVFYWLLFFLVQAFFLLLITCWSNPFIRIINPPADGNGLNPLLRHPGMVFHPPLLFLGYAGFTVPACAALASALSGRDGEWISATRNWTIMSWIFLTAGIVLGAWWAYLELGWGGYWAWDPVENASLVPWFTASAFLHTAVIGRRGKALPKTNLILIVLTYLLCVFGTYIVRSGVIESVHGYGGSPVGTALLLSIICGLFIMLVGAYLGNPGEDRPLSDLFSLQGGIIVLVWMLCALALVVTLGTMWPVISSLWSANSVGLDANFYNRVCLPLFTVVILIFLPALSLGWKGGVKHRTVLYVALGSFVLTGVLFFMKGVRHPVALAAAAGGAAALGAIGAYFAENPKLLKNRRTLGVWSLHAGLALMFIGVAFSGPYQTTAEAMLEPGQEFSIKGYDFAFKGVEEFKTPAMSGGKAAIEVTRNGKPLGTLVPEKRMYTNFNQTFSEVSVIPSLGNELYGVLLGFDESGRATVKISINPLVNWVWIGSVIMCLAGFLLLGGNRRKQAAENGEVR